MSAPEDYPWSGHLGYLGKQIKSWLTVDWVLSQLAKNKGVARRQYQEFVLDGLGEGYRDEFHRGSSDGRLLGDDRFVEEVLSQQSLSSGKKISLGEIIEVVCEERKVTRKALSSPSRERHLSRTRTIIAYLMMEYGKETLTDFAEYVGRDVATLSNAVREFRTRLGRDKNLHKMIQGLLREIGIAGSNNKNKKAKA